ncbi:MAG: NAD(P)H-dependent oxidoreductase [Chloroflexi bacterium]|nr:NAD(P)H-dependent oxidoreductase [Chloroflexota bacterium]MCI0769783.1 NAD(P)H-dependent oxidoreductase [Chloroflexota bacterium]
MGIQVLVLFDSRGGLIEQLAQGVGQGVESVDGASPRLLRIDDATREDLFQTDALVLGSPNWSGITGKLKQWLDGVGDVWAEGQLTDKIGAAFTAGSSRSAGIEFTMLTLMHWMLAGGMLIAGLPWNELMRTTGSYYGATAAGAVQEDDLAQARSLGRRVAVLALRMHPG